MEWDPKIIEQEIQECKFFEDHSYFLTERRVRRAETEFEAFEFRLENVVAKRAIEITFAPPRATRLPAVFQLYIENVATENDFNLEEYLRQYHSVNLKSGFRYSDYNGTFRQRCQSFLAFASNLLANYAEQIVQGNEWPQVHFDWGGSR